MELHLLKIDLLVKLCLDSNFFISKKKKKSICFANYNINFFKQKNFMHIALVFVLSKSVFNQVV